MNKGILFDLDDTLHDDTSTLAEAALVVAETISGVHHCDAKILYESFLHELEVFWEQLKAGRAATPKNPRAEMWKSALKCVEITVPGLAESAAQHFEAIRISKSRLLPGVVDLLTYLRINGVRVGVLTNGLKITHEAKIIALQVHAHVDKIFLSDDIGSAKPDVAAFAFALRHLGLSPTNTIMVGDRYDTDIVGAQNIGMRAIWFSIYGFSEDSQHPNIHRATGISELRSALTSMLGLH